MLHDLGQTAFGHDAEEIDERLFSHTQFTEKLIGVSQDHQNILGPSLQSIICDSEPDGWGLESVDQVLRLIRRQPTLPIDHLLTELIDGPLPTYFDLLYCIKPNYVFMADLFERIYLRVFLRCFASRLVFQHRGSGNL